MKQNLILFSFLLLSLGAYAAKVDTLRVFSKGMNSAIEVVTVVPEGDPSGKGYPVIYLLHGYGDNARGWVEKNPALTAIADREKLIFICPDGKTGWYWDSPSNPSSRYEQFISKELVAFADSAYQTNPVREARAITGLSMGGHGAMWNGLRHPDVFGAIASMSGGVDIRPFPNNWNMKEHLGERDQHPEVWDAHTVINLVPSIKNMEQAIYFDCGYSDFFFDVNTKLHEKLMEYKIDHDFQVRPGTHNWDYWRNSLDYHVLFFTKYFNKAQK
ncbi:MAG: alpha/beta hydrolase family protein [Bacteroidales bacterium]